MIFALRGAAAYQAFLQALSEAEPTPNRSLLEPRLRQATDPGEAVAARNDGAAQAGTTEAGGGRA